MSQYDERVPGVMGGRIACWVGGAVDVLAGIQLLLPPTARVLGSSGLREPGAAGASAVTAAVLMFGFALVLLWAQLRMAKRRGVLLIALAVVLALAVANLVFAVSGVLSWGQVAVPLALQALLVALFSTSYLSLVRRRTVFTQRTRLRRLG